MLRERHGYADVLDALEKGVPPDVVMVTIPEGRSRARDSAAPSARLRRQLPPCHAALAGARPARYGAQGARSLEGFLFPATYELKKGQPVRKLVDRQLRPSSRTSRGSTWLAKRKNLTPYDVLIIASLVEREAAVAKERPIIASVIYNRLKNDIRLGIDATTRFAVGNWERPLRSPSCQNPLALQHPRARRACRPARSATPASPRSRPPPARRRPASCSTWSSRARRGTHNFAETDAEFQRYVDAYNRAREKRGGNSPTTC